MTKTNNESKEDDLTDFPVLAQKLQSLARLIDERTEDDENSLSKMSTADAMVVLASLVNLYARVEKQDSQFRAGAYEESAKAKSRPLDAKEIHVLLEHLEFSDLAYETDTSALRERLAAASYFLVRHDASTEPGRVAHFVAMDDARKRVVIGFKGSSTVSDFLTDLVLHTAPHDLKRPFTDDDGVMSWFSTSASSVTEVRCHEGILTAAVTAADELAELLDKLFVPTGYEVVVSGHSLGAGTAALVGLLLRSRVPALRKKNRLRVYAYAPPPVLDFAACKACESFVTSVVDNSDIIPRVSVSNLVTLDKLFKVAHKKLREKGMLNKNNPLTAMGSLMKFGTVGENLFDLSEIDDFFEQELPDEDLKNKENLYVPGRVVVLYRTLVEEKDDDDTEKKNENDSGSQNYQSERCRHRWWLQTDSTDRIVENLRYGSHGHSLQNHTK